MQDHDELPFLVKLLDDEDEIVRQRLAEKFRQFPGDVSRQLDSLRIDLAATHLHVLGRARVGDRR